MASVVCACSASRPEPEGRTLHPHHLSIAPLTAAAFAPFGQVIETHGHAALHINDGHTEKFAALATIDTRAAGGRTAVHIYRSQPLLLPLDIVRMECHPLGSQAFIPLHPRPFLVVVAAPGKPPSATDLHGFVSNGHQGINVYRGVWHHYQISLQEPSDYLVIDRQGPGSNLQEHSLVQPAVIAELPGMASK